MQKDFENSLRLREADRADRAVASKERITFVALLAALGILATAVSRVEVNWLNLKSTVTEVVDAKLGDLSQLKTQVEALETKVDGLDTRLERVENTLSELVLLLRPKK